MLSARVARVVCVADGSHLAVNRGLASVPGVRPRVIARTDRGCLTLRRSPLCCPFHTAAVPKARVPKGLNDRGLQQTGPVEPAGTTSRSTEPPATRGPAQQPKSNTPQPVFGEPQLQPEAKTDVAKPAQRKTASLELAADEPPLQLQRQAQTDVAKPVHWNTALTFQEPERSPVILERPNESPRDSYSLLNALHRGQRARYDVEEAKKRSADPKAISLSMESRLVNLEITQRKTPKFAPNLEIIRSSKNTGLAASETNPENFRRTDSELRKVPIFYVWAALGFYVFGSYGSFKVYQHKARKERQRHEEERRWIDKLLDAEASGDEATVQELMEERRRRMCDSDEVPVQLDEAAIELDQRSAETFESLAESYDKGIGTEELAMGTNLLRRWLLSGHAKGDVLEIASGTGRNFNYYKPNQVKSLTLVDRSEAMLRVAKKKAMKRFGRNCLTKDSPTKLRVRTQLADAHDLSDFADQSFDTVVSTFTLCSLADPVRAIREMARVCKPDGRLIFLEHGRSGEENNPSWAPYVVTKYIDDKLDSTAERHREKWGCTWNKDISAVVAQAGLEVETEERWHFGTTYYIVARPPLHNDFEYSERKKRHPALSN